MAAPNSPTYFFARRHYELAAELDPDFKFGLLGLIHLELSSATNANPVWPIALLIVGINAIIAMLLPYAAESYPLAIRGRATVAESAGASRGLRYGARRDARHARVAWSFRRPDRPPGGAQGPRRRTPEPM